MQKPQKEHTFLSELQVFFWTMVILTVLYVQGLGIQMVLTELGVKF